MVKRGLIVAVVVAICDQWTKTLIRSMFSGMPSGHHIPITGFFDLTFTRNSGISFGLFNNGAAANPLVFTVIAAAVIALLIYWLSRVETGLLAVCIGLIIGGAIGNATDRLIDVGVVDFLDFHLGSWHWPAFNIADSAICIGVVLMLLEGLLSRRGGLPTKESGDLQR
jgi:signal peptidase II